MLVERIRNSNPPNNVFWVWLGGTVSPAAAQHSGVYLGTITMSVVYTELMGRATVMRLRSAAVVKAAVFVPALLAAQQLVAAFQVRAKDINCAEITELEWKKSSGGQVVKFLARGGPIVCFRTWGTSEAGSPRPSRAAAAIRSGAVSRTKLRARKAVALN